MIRLRCCRLHVVLSHLYSSFVERPCSIPNPLSSLEQGTDRWMMFPPLCVHDIRKIIYPLY